MPALSPTSAPAPVAGRRARRAWCLFDFANSAFPTVALTAFGAPYFVGVLIGPSGLTLGPWTLGARSAWGLAISLSMALVTLSAPLLGALVDRRPWKGRLLGAYVATCVLATAALGLLPPGAGLAAFALYVVANVAFEGAYVFYNAYLPELAPPERLGRLSGQAWALGYLGGLACLLLVRPFIPAAYDAAHASGGQVVYLVVALWYAVFSLPALIWLPRGHARGAGAQQGEQGAQRSALAEAWTQLKSSFSLLRATPALMFFLAAYLLYSDAITTFIEFTGVYTRDVLSFSPDDNITLFLVLNVVAAPGALLFGWLVDRIGGRRAISASLVVWMVVVLGAATVTTKAQFWGVALLAAVVIGATQSASRALMARLAPAKRAGEMMGFLALSGKASAIVGPALYGLVADAAARPDNQGFGHRVAVSLLGGLFVVAWLLMRRVPVGVVKEKVA